MLIRWINLEGLQKSYYFCPRPRVKLLLFLFGSVGIPLLADPFLSIISSNTPVSLSLSYTTNIHIIFYIIMY